MLPEVTSDRLKLILEAEELTYEVADDGRLVIHFEPLIAFVRINDNLLSFTGLWRGDITGTADLEKAYLVANKINEERTLPKTYVEDPHDDVAGSILFEFNMPIDDGLSDEQLKSYFMHAMSSFFSAEPELSQALPHVVTWLTENQGD